MSCPFLWIRRVIESVARHGLPVTGHWVCGIFPLVAFVAFSERAVGSAVPLWQLSARSEQSDASAVRTMSEGHLLLSAAVPVQRYKQVLGALMLTRDNRAIAASLREVRYDMLTIAVAALEPELVIFRRGVEIAGRKPLFDVLFDLIH